MGLGRSTCEIAAKVFSGEWLMNVLNCSGAISAIVAIVKLVRDCRKKRAEKEPKVDALILALGRLYSKLSHINEMCVELMEGNDAMLRMQICGLIDDVNYNEAILSCLSAIDNLSLDILTYHSKTIKTLESLREWLVNVADRFTFNPSLVDESKMHDEIKNFGKIVDDVIARLAKERYGFLARKRGRTVLYRQLGV